MTDSDVIRQMVKVAREIWRKDLTDSAGGNLSVLVGERVFVTPEGLGSRHLWRLSPRQIAVLDLHTGKSLRAPSPSREAGLHLAIYRNFPQAGAVIHAHPRHVMVFACTGTPLPAVAEYTWKYGTIELAAPAPAHSEQLAANVIRGLSSTQSELEKHGIALLLPAHGIVCVGRDLHEAFDTLYRMEVNARVALAARLLGKELLPPTCF